MREIVVNNKSEHKHLCKVYISICTNILYISDILYCISKIFYQNVVHCRSFSSIKLNIQFLLKRLRDQEIKRQLHNKNYAYYVYLFGGGDSSPKTLREQHCKEMTPKYRRVKSRANIYFVLTPCEMRAWQQERMGERRPH